MTILAYVIGPGHIEQIDGDAEFNVFVLAGQGRDIDRRELT